MSNILRMIDSPKYRDNIRTKKQAKIYQQNLEQAIKEVRDRLGLRKFKGILRESDVLTDSKPRQRRSKKTA